MLELLLKLENTDVVLVNLDLEVFLFGLESKYLVIRLLGILHVHSNSFVEIISEMCLFKVTFDLVPLDLQPHVRDSVFPVIQKAFQFEILLLECQVVVFPSEDGFRP